MQKSLKRVIVMSVVLSMLLTGTVSVINAEVESLTEARVVLDSSTPGVSTKYTFSFTTENPIPVGGRIRIVFPEPYPTAITTTGGMTCPSGTTAGTSFTQRSVHCNVAGTPLAAGTYQVAINSLANPAKSDPTPGKADTYVINLKTQTEATGEVRQDIEVGQVLVAILEPITVRATVNATLSFQVLGVASGQSIHSKTTTVTTTPTSIPFGVLEPNVEAIAAQDLTISTNASDGFSVTVFQDGNLTSAAGDQISSFNNNVPVPTSAATAWASPSAVLDDEDTYGHFGFSSQDNGVAGTCQDPASPGGYFAAQGWAGFDGTNVAEVMCHTGPADGTTTNKGRTRVGYLVEISDLQPAGEYENILTYIATPTF